MKVVTPALISDAQLISSNVVDNAYPAYVAATNYAVGARVIYDKVVYESVQTPNTGKTPNLFPLFWAVISPSNRWAMFDGSVSTATSVASPLTVTIAPGVADAVALLGLVGNTLVVTVKETAGGPVVYTSTTSLDGSSVMDWYQYFYQPFSPVTSVVLDNLPTAGTAQITANLTGAGTVACGLMMAGKSQYLGMTQYGAKAGIIDFSKKDTNLTTGATTLVKRAFSRTVSAALVIDNVNLSTVFKALTDLRATPALWVGTDVAGFDTLTVYGFYRQFSIDIPYYTESMCNLEIEGLV